MIDGVLSCVSIVTVLFVVLHVSSYAILRASRLPTGLSSYEVKITQDLLYCFKRYDQM